MLLAAASNNSREFASHQKYMMRSIESQNTPHNNPEHDQPNQAVLE